ncbi:16S ribosomal RNA methyltransferase A [Methanobrevibacter sp. TMH8]|uniref:16S rRNA (adenine(1518)-N(6)/adenine(1519)-N(6))- dimethyltransferase RsmA n=1 Tax=Methanobrevibacter sp. TMH8 TaxID=2848611 RepID=UPI001CCCBCA6|nr:16S rRNA (adenine(1518)-N(6)/adenine(1519)-N(6))-dimethyltransferase RsmA [Methanobrevibacter sp. TMH8]MBZ9570055.1 16S ribosomal RNA methyltransferase A [Methanobrevibacter sp. TMH8]
MKSDYNNSHHESLAKQTKKILQKYGIRLNRNLGQNYLIDDFKRKKIIEFAKLSKNDIVLEIGPGIGTLTTELAKKTKKVVAIEQDKKIYDILKQRIEDESIENIELINEDAVKTDISNFVKCNKIVSNLPYQISSPITFKFLEFDFDLAILMYQKEFAERMIAKTGDKNYSRLSAMLYFKGDIEFLDNVSPESFIPRPKVDSSVIKLTPKNIDKNLLIEDNAESYSKTCKAIFQHKNKKVRNALIDSRHILGYKDKKELRNLIDSNFSLEPFLTNRVINTSPEEILELAILLKPIIK